MQIQTLKGEGVHAARAGRDKDYLCVNPELVEKVELFVHQVGCGRYSYGHGQVEKLEVREQIVPI